MNQTFFTTTKAIKRKAFQILICLSFFTLIAALPEAKSSHLVGGKITYQCIGANQYRVTLTLYRDCNGTSLSSRQTIFYNAPNGASGSFRLSRTSVLDITPLCPGETSTCNGGSIDGVEKHTYTGIIGLSSVPPSYTLSYSTCCRNSIITTLFSPGSQSFYISTLLDNNAAHCNNSPVFNNDASAYGCMGQVINYNHGVTDADGDQLVFSLVACHESLGNPVTYATGYSGTSPLSTTGGVNINAATGAITFTPDIVQVGVLCVLVEEYRGGVKIGEVVRDIQFNIENCGSGSGSNNPPIASGPYLYNANPGSQLCFNITSTDPNAGDNVSMTTNNGISGGTFTPALPQGFSMYPSTQFCWTPTAADQNATHFFTISVQDDACPSVGLNTFTYQVIVGNACNLSIDCPDNILVGNDYGQCGANVYFNAPTLPSGCSNVTYECTTSTGGSSNCDATSAVDLSITFDDFTEETSWDIESSGGIIVESGGAYGAQAGGSTINLSFTLPDDDYTFTIYDRFGDGICCSYGNGSYILSSNGNTLAAGGSFGASESTDFCVEAPTGGSTVVNSGDFFPVGTTTVTCTATDGQQTESCTFNITVTDVMSPTLATACPSNITECGAQNISWTPPTATDNCGIVNTMNNYSPGDYFSVGSHTVSYTFYDAAGLSVSCSFVVTINPLPQVSINQSNLPTWCQGIKVLDGIVANSGALTYPLTFAWSDGLGSNPTVIAPANGTYYLTVTDALGCFSVASTVVNENISTLFSAYTIIAGDQLEMFESTVYSGGVGVEDAEEVVVHENTSILTFMRANMSGVDVDGSSFVNNPINADFSAPLPAFQSNPYNDFNHITVAANSTMTLYGSRYGNITIQSGATLNIANAQMYIKSLTTAENATVNFQQPTYLKIRKKMNIGRLNTINSSAYTSVIFVSDKAEIGEGSNVVVNIYVPEGLEVNDSGSTLTTYMTGIFISGDGVSSDYYVIWNWNLNCSAIGVSNPAYLTETFNDEYEIMDNQTKQRSLTIYPNPTSGLLNIDVSEYLNKSVDINIYDALGKVVWTQHFDELENNVIKADFSSSKFHNQLYLLSVQDDEGVRTKLFILNK